MMPAKLATLDFLEVKKNVFEKNFMTSPFLPQKFVGPGCYPLPSPVKNDSPVMLVDAYAND